MFLTTRGLILREVRFKEADKILTVLTEGEGKLTVRARGALRRGSKVAAATQQLAWSELTLFGNRGAWSLNEAETLEQFLGLRDDISALALANYFAEVLETLSDEDSPNPAVLHLGLNALFALSRGLYTQEHIKAVFELRLMCLAGFEPQVESCGVCGGDIEEPVFCLEEGMAHCLHCPPPVGEESLPLGREALDAMRYIISAPSKRVFSFAVPGPALVKLARVCERYVSLHTDRRFKTLDYWKMVK